MQPRPRDDQDHAHGSLARWGEFAVGVTCLREGQVLLAESLLEPTLARAEAELGRRIPFACSLASLLAADIGLTHVPCRGSTPALQDLTGGHVQLMFDGLATSIPLLKGGNIKAFAVRTPWRSPMRPDVPQARLPAARGDRLDGVVGRAR